MINIISDDMNGDCSRLLFLLCSGVFVGIISSFIVIRFSISIVRV